MKSTLIRHLTVASLLAVAGGLGAEEAIELKIKFEPGKTYVQKQDVTMDMNMQGNEITTNMTQIYDLSAAEHEKGTAVTFTFHSMEMDTMMGGQKMMSYDSENPEGPMANAMKGLADLKATFIYDEKGEVVESQLDEVPNLQAAGIGKEQLEQMAKQSQDFLPKEPVKVGDEWTSETEIPLGQGQSLTMSLTMKLLEVMNKGGQPTAKIRMDGEMAGEAGGMPMKTKKFTGTIWHDTKMHQTVKADIDMEMDIGGDGEMGGTMKMKSVQTLEGAGEAQATEPKEDDAAEEAEPQEALEAAE